MNSRLVGVQSTPPAPPPFLWCFDRGIETLVFVDTTSRRIFAWSRKEWDRAGFLLDGLRGLPPVPREIHQTIEAMKRKAVIQ